MNDSVNRYEELAKAYKELQQENEEEYQKLIKEKQVTETSATIASLTPNIFHQWGEVAALTIAALGAGATGKVTEYMIEFQSGSTPTVLSLPNGIKWANGDDPTQDIKANKTYQISIVNNLGVYAEF